MRDTGGDHRPPRPSGDDAPKFGRLLLVLVAAVLLVGTITLASEAWFS